MLPPDAILASSGFALPLVGSVQDDPDAPDGAWLGASLPFSIRFSFPTPAGTLLGTQTFKTLLRKRTAATAWNATVSLYESGALVRQLSTTSITSNSGQVITATFNASEVANAANVEIVVAGAVASGSTMLVGANLGSVGGFDPTVQTAYNNAYEAWLGTSLDFVQVHTGRLDSVDYVSSVSYFAMLYGGQSREIRWSIPMLYIGGPTSGTFENTGLAAAAAGSYDSLWTQIANAVVAGSKPPTGPIWVRTGWEFNGTWQEWSVTSGGEAQFVSAWQRFVNVFRAVTGGSRFKFIWCPNHIFGSANLESCYPGTSYVDMISLDFYVHASYTGNESGAIAFYFGETAATQGSLKWVASYAAAQGKPWGIDEWGVLQSGWANYITAGWEFFTKTGAYSGRAGDPAAFSAWWESNSAYASMLSENDQGSTGTKYQELFG